jgi:hypothetical protein
MPLAPPLSRTPRFKPVHISTPIRHAAGEDEIWSRVAQELHTPTELRESEGFALPTKVKSLRSERSPVSRFLLVPAVIVGGENLLSPLLLFRRSESQKSNSGLSKYIWLQNDGPVRTDARQSLSRLNPFAGLLSSHSHMKKAASKRPLYLQLLLTC